MKRLDSRAAGFDTAFEALLQQARDTTSRVDAPVAEIIAAIRDRGDAALCELTTQFDHHPLGVDQIRIGSDEIDDATNAIDPELRAALDVAATRIEAFHSLQIPQDIETTDATGLRMGMRWNALDAVGLYVPGGKAAYPSSVLMNAIPARVAGVKRIAMCVPTPGGALNPLVLAAARRAGVSEIYRVGGAQAVAAMAYGTATIAPVDRIVGPGNAYVAEAKRQVFGRVGIDGIAGPSEVVILADRTADPRRVAIDLLAQAEHDESAQAILLTDDPTLADAVARAVETELHTLTRPEAAQSWREHGCIILVQDWTEGAALSDRLASEHLQIMVADPAALFARIRHCGAAFLGSDSPEALGDYVAGPNHVLPTGRTARFASGLSVYDFVKRTTWIEANSDSLAQIGPAAVALAEAEGLQAHARSVAMRLGQPPHA
ncbi:histidinol dehydrogenase [Acidisphaera sp. L21]|uniref:histidinol dehydrogenase n=1 Tax=Acidisphaera sp. L21 TaxID=1641851 RepID=UPI00131C8A0B|nr:histidinol dehydrogenase [Acidisphaera sp. L21]